MSIFIWEWKDSYKAMRWPCDEWFHVPTWTEISSLKTILSDLWIDTSNWECLKTYLKIPFAWYLAITGSSTYIDSRNNSCSLWSSSRYSSWYSRVIWGSSSYFDVTWYGNRNKWYWVRPFKDESVIPNNSWTRLYNWTWDAGIYHNSTLWLISLSSDWTIRTTIADKNLWATIVYNSWDTLSASNCWGYFQWWNNYMFDFSWSVANKSGTRVSTSWYWPWNYYSSSTFIYYNGWNGDRSNPSNDNLRWWVTGVTKWPNVKAVYKWTTKIRPV